MMTSAESGEDGNNYGYRLPQNQEERLWAFQVALVVKNPPANAGRCKRCGFDPWVEKIPWRRKWQPTPVFLPGESMDRGAWRATVHGVTQSWTRLKRLGTPVLGAGDPEID